MTQGPESPSPSWPPAALTTYALARLTTSVHWQLEEVAFQLGAGRLAPEQQIEVAELLEQLAAQFRAHAVAAGHTS